MNEIAPGLFQFSAYIPPANLSIHHYLLTAGPGILFATGTAQQARAEIPQIREALGGGEPGYAFVSHMESDEAGGLFALHQEFPGMKVICGALAARELPGWGYDGPVVTMHDGNTLQDGALDLRFVDYPSEVHGQDGLLVLDQTSGVLYSSDLFLRLGNGAGQLVEATWKNEVDLIGPDRVENAEKRAQLQDDLRALAPRYVAVGHGFCLKCR